MYSDNELDSSDDDFTAPPAFSLANSYQQASPASRPIARINENLGSGAASRLKLVLASAGVGLYVVVWLAVDTNGDAYIINELVEYISADEVNDWIFWAIGLGIYTVQNIPWSVLLFILAMAKLQVFKPVSDPSHVMILDNDVELTLLEDGHSHQLVHGHNHTHDDEDFMGPEHSHGHHHHTFAETLREFFLIGMTSGALGAASCWDTSKRILGSSAPLTLLIPVSTVSALIQGSSDWIIHSHFFHAAHDEGEGSPLVRTFRDNVWSREDKTFCRKTYETYIKVGIILQHFFLGYFSADALLRETGLKTHFPWGSVVVSVIPAALVTYFEGITETFCIDSLEKTAFQEYQLHPVTQGALYIAGIIHSLPAAIMMANLTYQATAASSGELFWLINLVILIAYAVPILHTGVVGYYAVLAQPPQGDDAEMNVSFDDVVRRVICQPRVIKARRVGYDEIGESREKQTGHWCCCFRPLRKEPSVLLLEDSDEEQDEEQDEAFDTSLSSNPPVAEHDADDDDVVSCIIA